MGSAHFSMQQYNGFGSQNENRLRRCLFFDLILKVIQFSVLNCLFFKNFTTYCLNFFKKF